MKNHLDYLEFRGWLGCEGKFKSDHLFSSEGELKRGSAGPKQK